ncbi:MAG TPA: hypothetical protein VGE21_07120 [Flavobacteriales bacterium]
MYDLYDHYVDLEYWEFLLSFLYVVILYFYFARQKNLMLRKFPEYRFFLGGLFAKILGGVAYGLVYTYYYDGGDTMGYFYGANTLANLFVTDPGSYLRLIVQGNTPENFGLFTMETGWPFQYMYDDDRTFILMVLLTPLCLLTFRSYMVMTVVLASLSYIGVWRCYRSLVRYFPTLDGKFAIAFLFMPSVIFWGSGIVKDTFTFAAMCWLIHYMDRWFQRGERGPWLVVGGLLSAILLIAIKPYIFMALLPAMIAWVYYERIIAIRNKLIKYTILPLGTVLMLGASLFLLDALGDRLDKFSLDKALETIVVSKEDMTRAHAYGNNFFDVGELDESWGSVLRASPVAVNAALFRPYLWEARNVVMVAAGAENLWLLLLALAVLVKGYFVGAFKMLVGNPITLMGMAYSLVFAFVIGISTPNFGALVRFKIPLVPLFVCACHIILFLLEKKRELEGRGMRFDPRNYIKGDHVGQEARRKLASR